MIDERLETNISEEVVKRLSAEAVACFANRNITGRRLLIVEK